MKFELLITKEEKQKQTRKKRRKFLLIIFKLSAGCYQSIGVTEKKKMLCACMYYVIGTNHGCCGAKVRGNKNLPRATRAEKRTG